MSELTEVFTPDDFRAMVTLARAQGEPELAAAAVVIDLFSRAVIA